MVRCWLSRVHANLHKNSRNNISIKDAFSNEGVMPPPRRWGHFSYLLCTSEEIMDEDRKLDAAQQPKATRDMGPQAFRQYGHQVVDWMADYLAGVGDYPVRAQTAPGDIRRSLPAQPPQQPE